MFLQTTLASSYNIVGLFQFKVKSISVDLNLNTDSTQMAQFKKKTIHEVACWFQCWKNLSLTLPLLLKLSWKILEPWFVPWSFFLLHLLCISINLPCNTVVMSWLVLLVATWNCWISYKNGCAGLLVLLLLLHFKVLCWENLSRCSTKLISVCKKLPLALDCQQSKYSQ